MARINKPLSQRSTKPRSIPALPANPAAKELLAPLANVDPPSYMAGDSVAVECWEYFAPRLIKLKLLTEMDLVFLEQLCACYSMYRAAYIEYYAQGPVVESRTGAPVKNPAAAIINESLRNIIALSARLGLSPSDRANLINHEDQQRNSFDDL